MTPEQMIKSAVLARAIDCGDVSVAEPITEENIDELFAASNEECELQDFLNEFREGVFETNIPAPSSRHYETKSVAAKMVDGSWVGWTYYYGGGKYGNPEEIDWIDGAYALTCVEEQKMLTVRTFSKSEAEPA